jgi:hypothetical protein
MKKAPPWDGGAVSEESHQRLRYHSCRSLTSLPASPNPPPPSWLRRLAADVHGLGKRPMFELFIEASEGTRLPERLEAYRRLVPVADFIAANYVDRLLPAAHLVGGR